MLSNTFSIILNEKGLLVDEKLEIRATLRTVSGNH